MRARRARRTGDKLRLPCIDAPLGPSIFAAISRRVNEGIGLYRSIPRSISPGVYLLRFSNDLSSFWSRLSWLGPRLEPDLVSPATTASEFEPEPDPAMGGVAAGLGEDVGVATTGTDGTEEIGVVVCGTLDTNEVAGDGVDVEDVTPGCAPELVGVVAGCPPEAEGVVVADGPPEPVGALAGGRSAFVACCIWSAEGGGGASFRPSLNSSPRRCRVSVVIGCTGRGGAAPVMRIAWAAVTSTPAPTG